MLGSSTTSSETAAGGAPDQVAPAGSSEQQNPLKPSGAAGFEEALAATDPGERARLLEECVDAKVQAAPTETAVMSVMSRLASAPPNLHQYVVFSAVRAAQDGTPPPRTLLMIAVATVILQCSVAVGVMFGAALPACAKAHQCSQGYYCDPTIGRCDFCGSRLREFAPVQWSGPCVCESTGRPLEDNEDCQTVPDPSCRTFHNPYDPNYDGANQTWVLEACAAPRKSFELRRGM